MFHAVPHVTLCRPRSAAVRRATRGSTTAAWAGPRPGRRRFFNRRSGASTLQLILALPALVFVSLAVFEFGVLMIVQQSVTTAAIEGARAAAREATVGDANAAAIAAVNNVLDVHHLAIDSTSTDTTSNTRLVLEFDTLAPVSTGDPDLTCSPPSSPTLAVGEVRVTVCLDLTTAPLLNSLSAFGFDLTGRTLEISSMARREF